MPNGAEEAFRWGDRREPPLFYKERLGTGSPPHPTRLRRPTYGLWWLRLDLTEQSPGLFDPRGEGFGRGSFPAEHPILPPNRLTRQGTPRRVSPPAGGERKSNHVLTGSAGQNILLAPRVPALLARVGVHPPILGAQRSGSQNSCLSQPAQPVGGPLRAWDTGPQASFAKKENPSLATNQREVGPGRREPLSALVFFPPAFFQRKPGSPAGVGGEPTLQGLPCNGSNGTTYR